VKIKFKSGEFWVRLQKQYEMNKELIELRKIKNTS